MHRFLDRRHAVPVAKCRIFRKYWVLLLAVGAVLAFLFWRKPNLQQVPKSANLKIAGYETLQRWVSIDADTADFKQSKECKNLLSNLTAGEWKLRPGANVSVLDDTHHMYWIEKGILKHLWREDGKCGYKNLQSKVPGSKWPAVGSWCDKDGPKPCCNHKENGNCTEPTENNCECDSCVDTRKYIYAELSDWHPHDHRCSWTKFDGTQACDVIESSPYDDIRFVGDSLMRNMFAAFMMLLSNDTVRGAWGKQMTDKQKVSCVAEQFFFWDDCRTVIKSMEDLVHREKLCEGRKLNFTSSMHVYWSKNEAKAFHELIERFKGKKGKLVLLGIGMHMHMNATLVIESYLGPAVKIRQDFYKDKNVTEDLMWPKIVFTTPMLISLLKPPEFLQGRQSDKTTAEFIEEIKDYGDQHSIPVFDFRSITKLVHSFDGTHYGLGVNLMKNQILLNYIKQQRND